MFIPAPVKTNTFGLSSNKIKITGLLRSQVTLLVRRLVVTQQFVPKYEDVAKLEKFLNNKPNRQELG